MPKQPRQKEKLLYLQKILLEKTDENHALTLSEIIGELEAYGIKTERKSLYDDIRLLQVFGLDVCSEKSKTVRYYVGSRDFQTSELKLLVDAIQSSKFITEKKSLELIKKLESLTSHSEALLLQEQVIISNRVKTQNETIYYNVDRIHDAISRNREVTFYYNRWVLDLGSVKKIKTERRRDGALYQVSPWALCWDDENYYLIAFDEAHGELRHYRVDKMERVEVTEEPRKGEETVGKLNLANYAKSTFSMFAGKPVSVALSVDKTLVGVIADRFGSDVFVTADDKNESNFKVVVNVNVSDQFFGWVFALGDKIKITAPKEVAEKFRNHARKVSALYEEAGI